MATAPWGGPMLRPLMPSWSPQEGRKIPEALRRQLKIGGRLIIPIGERGGTQELVKVVRDGDERFHEEDLGPVTFVPLVGAGGWGGPGPDATLAFEKLWPKRPPVSARAPSATALIRAAAVRLPGTEDPAFSAMFDGFANARVVLLGEASHGTSEFYRARAQITRRLIERHGFNIVAVEADWPDAARIDRYVRHKALHVGSGPAFRRFPQWMWRNVEVANFVDWLRAHNAALHPAEHAGFFGLDIYNMNASIAAVVEYLDRIRLLRRRRPRGSVTVVNPLATRSGDLWPRRADHGLCQM